MHGATVKNVEEQLITNKSSSVASSWSRLYLLNKAARLCEQNERVLGGLRRVSVQLTNT